MIGLIADTHDNMKAIKKAVKYFNSKNVSLVLHAGDLVSPFTADEFMKLKAEFRAVYGNNEGEREGLRKKYSSLCDLTDYFELEHGGRKISVYHGTIPHVIDALAESQLYDLIITGHTHVPEIRKNNKTLLVNPGECCGYLTGKKTIAMVDEKNLSTEIIEL